MSKFCRNSVYMTGDIIVRSEDIMENLYVIKKGTVSIEFTTPGNTFQDEIIVRKYGIFGGESRSCTSEALTHTLPPL